MHSIVFESKIKKKLKKINKRLLSIPKILEKFSIKLVENVLKMDLKPNNTKFVVKPIS